MPRLILSKFVLKINTHFISKKYDFTKIFIKKSISSLVSKASWKFYLTILPVTNQPGINLMLPDNHQQLHHTYFRFYIYGGNILSLKNRQKQLCHTFLESYLKLVSTIFYQFFFHQMIALQKLWKMFFISSKKLFSFSRYSKVCISVFPSFSSSQPLR